MEKNSMFSLNNKESSPKGLKCAFSGRLKIHLCVLQNIGPLGRCPKNIKRDRRTDGRMDGRTDGRTDGWTDGRTDKQKFPCVLQDFVPFGAAALPLIPIYNHAKQGNGYRWPHIALGQPVFTYALDEKGFIFL